MAFSRPVTPSMARKRSSRSIAASTSTCVLIGMVTVAPPLLARRPQIAIEMPPSGPVVLPERLPQRPRPAGRRLRRAGDSEPLRSLTGPARRQFAPLLRPALFVKQLDGHVAPAAGQQVPAEVNPFFDV